MRKNILLNSFLLIALGFCELLSAQTPNATVVSVGVPQFGGSGCPSGLSSAVSPDGSSLSLLFEAYEVSADLAAPFARANCELSIPLHVPPGLSVTLAGADFRGFHDLPPNAASSVHVEYRLSGGTTVPSNTSVVGPATQNYILQHNVRPTNQPSSSCSGSSVLRIITSLTVSTNNAGERAIATLDSLDLVMNDLNRDSGVMISLTYHTCGTSAASSLGISTALLVIASTAAAVLL